MDEQKLAAGETELGGDFDYAERHGLIHESGVPMTTVLYSIVGDVYKVPSANVDLWLSVQVDAEPHPGAAVCTADGRGWRRAYRAVHVIYAGRSVALPADDPLVVDYLRQVKAEEL